MASVLFDIADAFLPGKDEHYSVFIFSVTPAADALQVEIISQHALFLEPRLSLINGKRAINVTEYRESKRPCVEEIRMQTFT